jgi:hypothetical protein
MSKLDRRLTLPLGVVGRCSDGGGSGRGDGGGEFEGLKDIDMRGASWSTFSRFCN